MSEKFIQIENSIFDENQIDIVQYAKPQKMSSSLTLTFKSGATLQFRGDAADNYWQKWQKKINKSFEAPEAVKIVLKSM